MWLNYKCFWIRNPYNVVWLLYDWEDLEMQEDSHHALSSLFNAFILWKTMTFYDIYDVFLQFNTSYWSMHKHFPIKVVPFNPFRRDSSIVNLTLGYILFEVPLVRFTFLLHHVYTYAFSNSTSSFSTFQLYQLHIPFSTSRPNSISIFFFISRLDTVPQT